MLIKPRSMEQGAAPEMEPKCVCLGHEAFEGVLGHLYSDAHLAGGILVCVFRKKVKTIDVDWELEVSRSGLFYIVGRQLLLRWR